MKRAIAPRCEDISDFAGDHAALLAAVLKAVEHCVREPFVGRAGARFGSCIGGDFTSCYGYRYRLQSYL